MRVNSKVREYIEFELRHYHQTRRELEQIRDCIMHGSGSSDESGIRGSGTSDPTAQRALKLMSNARLKRLEETTRAIENVVENLDESKYKLIELRYWKKPRTLNDTGIAMEISVDRATLWRWNSGIIQAIAMEMGLA